MIYNYFYYPPLNLTFINSGFGLCILLLFIVGIDYVKSESIYNFYNFATTFLLALIIFMGLVYFYNEFQYFSLFNYIESHKKDSKTTTDKQLIEDLKKEREIINQFVEKHNNFNSKLDKFYLFVIIFSIIFCLHLSLVEFINHKKPLTDSLNWINFYGLEKSQPSVLLPHLSGLKYAIYFIPVILLYIVGAVIGGLCIAVQKFVISSYFIPTVVYIGLCIGIMYIFVKLNLIEKLAKILKYLCIARNIECVDDCHV